MFSVVCLMIRRPPISTRSLSLVTYAALFRSVGNALEFLNQARYWPDRRDLNGSFPGSDKGSLAARLASLFLREIVGRAQYGVDRHTGAIHRPNQIGRASCRERVCQYV